MIKVQEDLESNSRGRDKEINIQFSKISLQLENITARLEHLESLPARLEHLESLPAHLEHLESRFTAFDKKLDRILNFRF